MLHFFATFFALLLLIDTNINICTFSFEAISKLGSCFLISTICLGSISLNLSKVISFSILLCQCTVFLIILHNSIRAAFSETWRSNIDLHFFILKISRIQPSFIFRVTLNVFLFYKLIFWKNNILRKTCLKLQSNLYKMTTLGTTQKWSSCTGGSLIQAIN